MGWVLVCPQCFKYKISLSLDATENRDKNGTVEEFTRKKIKKNMTMMENQSQTKRIKR